MNKLIVLIGALTLTWILGCGSSDAPNSTSQAVITGHGEHLEQLVHADWTRNATIYQINVRQHTPEGTLNACGNDLPRLKALGADILWLMPIHPIGEVNRKGGENSNNYMVQPGSSSLGSPYSVKDYMAVNPDFGTEEDLKAFTAKAHDLGMKVILDWVANHTAFDSEWTQHHMEFFLLDEEGKLQPPTGTDWWDVTQLDWENGRATGLYDAMKDAMVYWVRDCGIDGYRCDVAEKVPTDFWDMVRRELELVQPEVFMLAEAEVPEHHQRAFDMSYAWEMHHVMNEVGKGNWSADSLRSATLRQHDRFGSSAYRMMFITNHDENSWNGTIAERLGVNGDAMAIVAGTMMGMPLVYSGQEAANPKRLRFFEKDTVLWGDYPKRDLYHMIYRINHENEALWNGEHGGMPAFHEQSSDKIIAYTREKSGNEVTVVANFGDVIAYVPIEAEETWVKEWGESEIIDGVASIPAHSASVWSRRRQ